MKSFVRMTKLPDIVGRAAYITNHKKQEEIVLASDPVDWQPYVDYEMANKKTKSKNNQGRELIVSLPNEWYELPREELQEKVQTLAEAAVGKSTDMQWAVHWNKDRTNLHVHIIFSERKKEHSEKRWDRDIYLTAEGKIARKKADRATDAEGNFLPPIHRKGDLQVSEFTEKDTQYKSKGWLHDKKQELTELYKSWGVTIDENEVLHQYHEGKGSESAEIKKKNEAVKVNNRLYKGYTANLHAHPGVLKEKMIEAAKQGKVLNLFPKDNALSYTLIPVDEFYRQYAEIKKQKAKEAQNQEFWRRYRATRESAWAEFSRAQSHIISDLKDTYEEKRRLYEMCSETIYDWKGRPEGTRMLPREDLEELGYFEKREELNEDISELRDNLKTAREYMDLAKAHQSIVQSLMTAGADSDILNAAMDDFERAMRAMANYAENGDFENRRLKAAKFSLEQAQKRANSVISKLEAAEISEVMKRCDEEYQTFLQEEPELNPADPLIPAGIDSIISSAEQQHSSNQTQPIQKNRSERDDR